MEETAPITHEIAADWLEERGAYESAGLLRQAARMQLSVFCDTCRTGRYDVSTPWVDKGWVYAANGVIAVRSPTKQADTDTSGEGKARPDLAPMFNQVAWDGPAINFAGLIRQVAKPVRDEVLLGDKMLSESRLDDIQRLPGVLLLEGTQYTEEDPEAFAPVCFVFAGGGQAMLMPLSAPEGATR